MSAVKQYRKRPVVIEAMQWDGSAESATVVVGWILREGATACFYKHLMDGDYLQIDTLEGPIIASAGDFIIRGVNGEFYPCKPDIFAKTYEHAEESKQWA